MDAGSRTALGLLAEMNVRYLVPAYQRPYSWDEAPCLRSPVDNLERPDTPIQETSARIMGSLALFERRVSTLQDLGAL